MELKNFVLLKDQIFRCLNSNFYQVQHPAAKMIVMASHMQEQEVGDGTNFVLVFAGALLELAEELLRIGLSVSEASVHFITYSCLICAHVYTHCKNHHCSNSLICATWSTRALRVVSYPILTRNL